MADLHPSEDQAVLYLLDRLPDAERREFEARLAESAELRALLRDLEEGSVAMAMSVPHRRPPALIWKRIEKTVTEEHKRETPTPSFWFRWWRYGWAAAAVCLVGWLVPILWLGRTSNSSGPNSQQTTQQPTSVLNEGLNAVAVNEPKEPLPSQSSSVLATAEILGLRQQIADLSNHITHLSQSVAQQQALLLETNRLKFFQLTASEGTPATNNPMSAGLQHALFLAMARELGWLPPNASTELAPAGSFPQWQRDSMSTASTATNRPNVDFVDLRSGSNMVANPPSQPPTETQPSNTPDPNLLTTTAASGSVPGFVSGTNAILAFDASVATPGATLRFWSGTPGQWYQLIGSSVLGNNPMVVTIPFSAGGGTLTVTAGNGSGSSNILGQFPPTPGGP